MKTTIESVLKNMEGREEIGSRHIAYLLSFIAAQQETLFSRMGELLDVLGGKSLPETNLAPLIALLEKIEKKDFPKTDFSLVVKALEKLLKKEIKTQSVSFPETQRVLVENPQKESPVLKEILEAVRDLKNEEKTIVIENKVPVDRRPLAIPGNIGPVEFRQYKARYHKINVKPQEGTSDPSGDWSKNTTTVFTLLHLPEAGTDECWVGGVKLFQDAGDYSLVGQKVTFLNGPPTAQPYFSYDVI